VLSRPYLRLHIDGQAKHDNCHGVISTQHRQSQYAWFDIEMNINTCSLLAWSRWKIDMASDITLYSLEIH
jgi:hypothetical protein